MSDKGFPIQQAWRRGPDGLRLPNIGPTDLPWAMIEPHDAQAKANHGGQGVQRLAERGGLCACEAVAVLEDREWTPFNDHADAERRLAVLLAEFQAGRAMSDTLKAELDQAYRIIGQVGMLITGISVKTPAAPIVAQLQEALANAESALAAERQVSEGLRQRIAQLEPQEEWHSGPNSQDSVAVNTPGINSTDDGNRVRDKLRIPTFVSNPNGHQSSPVPPYAPEAFTLADVEREANYIAQFHSDQAKATTAMLRYLAARLRDDAALGTGGTK